MHKWVCAPKASAALHVAPEWRATLRPLVTSQRATDGYLTSFGWTGTRDPTAILAVPSALAFFSQAGWNAVRRHNNELALQGADLIARKIGTDPPAASGLAAAMQVVQLPAPLT